MAPGSWFLLRQNAKFPKKKEKHRQLAGDAATRVRCESPHRLKPGRDIQVVPVAGAGRILAANAGSAVTHLMLLLKNKTKYKLDIFPAQSVSGCVRKAIFPRLH